jgi:hypothetical protein
MAGGGEDFASLWFSNDIVVADDPAVGMKNPAWGKDKKKGSTPTGFPKYYGLAVFKRAHNVSSFPGCDRSGKDRKRWWAYRRGGSRGPPPL